MKILVISSESWDTTNSGGNTYSNLFSGWEGIELSNVFCRDAKPNNSICKSYFRITAKMLLKNIFRPSRIGKAFRYDGQADNTGNVSAHDSQGSKEKKLIALIHKYNLNFAYWAEDILWSLKGWQNVAFDSFLRETSPDVIFTFAIPTVQRKMLLDYIKKKTNAKIVLMIADHVCHEYFSSDKKHGKAAARRMGEMLSSADKVYAITDELIDAYSAEFGVDISILRKTCSFEADVCTSIGHPIKIVYAGNLLYGRADILYRLAKAIAEINSKEQQIMLEIYSATQIEEDEKQRLSIAGASAFMGPRPFDEIKSILSSSDVILHVESFEKKQIEYVKYSFSTKITDALESGRNFLVIGPKGISSVEYPRQIPGVVVVDNLDEIKNCLNKLTANRDLMIENANKIRRFAIEHHSREEVLPALRSDFEKICGGSH